MNRKDTYYFSHDANALSDPKILAMRCDYGLEGYGLYFAILEMLRNESNYKLSLNKNTFRAIKIQTGTTIDVEKFINDCIFEYKGENENGLFNSNTKDFWSESFIRRMQKYEELKEKRSQAANARWNKQKEKIGSRSLKIIKGYCTCNANALHKHYTCNAKSKKLYAKLCKLNEMKLNKIYTLNYTKLNLLFNYIYKANATFDRLSETDKSSIINILKRLDLYMENNTIKYLPAERIEELKIQYYAIKELYYSPYKVYINNLTAQMFIEKYLKSKEYVSSKNKKDSEKYLTNFMNYFIKCLQNEIKKEKNNGKNM